MRARVNIAVHRQTGDKMAGANYYIYGLGANSDDLHYIGWTEKSIGEQPDLIFSDLLKSSSNAIANWVKDAVHGGKISIFEIESAPSVEDAKDSAMFWCEYYRWLGLDVITDRC